MCSSDLPVASDMVEMVPSDDKSDLSLANFKDSYSQAKKNQGASISAMQPTRIALH